MWSGIKILFFYIKRRKNVVSHCKTVEHLLPPDASRSRSDHQSRPRSNNLVRVFFPAESIFLPLRRTDSSSVTAPGGYIFTGRFFTWWRFGTVRTEPTNPKTRWETECRRPKSELKDPGRLSRNSASRV